MPPVPLPVHFHKGQPLKAKELNENFHSLSHAIGDIPRGPKGEKGDKGDPGAGGNVTPTAGVLLLGNGTTFVGLAPGTQGQVLTTTAPDTVAWEEPASNVGPATPNFVAVFDGTNSVTGTNTLSSILSGSPIARSLSV